VRAESRGLRENRSKSIGTHVSAATCAREFRVKEAPDSRARVRRVEEISKLNGRRGYGRLMLVISPRASLPRHPPHPSPPICCVDRPARASVAVGSAETRSPWTLPGAAAQGRRSRPRQACRYLLRREKPGDRTPASIIGARVRPSLGPELLRSLHHLQPPRNDTQTPGQPSGIATSPGSGIIKLSLEDRFVLAGLNFLLLHCTLTRGRGVHLA
jgi:hypothetical protein